MRTSIVAGALAVLAVARWRWALRWLFSGTPILSLCLILGADMDRRVLPMIPLWTMVLFLNMSYAVLATSWLLYGVFTAVVYPAIFLTSLFQFDLVSRAVRKSLRKAIREAQFVHDTIALFDIPALEIDVDVQGLMVVRGLTVSLSSLTVIAHGVEVGIKLADDIELAISTENVTIYLFRRVEITDCIANVKGRPEMTFGELEATEDEDGDAVMVEATPLLQAASKARPKMVKMKSRMTHGREPQGAGVMDGWKSMRKMSPEDEDALAQYEHTIKQIESTDLIGQSRRKVTMTNQENDSDEEVRAAICSAMQAHPSVPHPPKRSIKLTTLQNLSKPRTRRLMHRMPMLLRLILNPIAYFHPVYMSSITAGGSGKWISYLLQTHLFKDYAEDNKQIRKLEKRILSWLADANFVLELADIKGIASVPFVHTYDIQAQLKFEDIIAYRTLTPEAIAAAAAESNKTEKQEQSMTAQVVRLGGADATFSIPSFLLPHHEHLLPDPPNRDKLDAMEGEVEEANGKPKEVQAEQRLEKTAKDLANVGISAHARLPAVFSQDLLNFIAALVKATKVVEMEKDGEIETKIKGIKDFGQALSKGMKDSMKKTVVDGIVSDKWIAKMVGKITRKLEEAQGEVGYSGDIPVELAKYRLPPGHPEMSKILA